MKLFNAIKSFFRHIFRAAKSSAELNNSMLQQTAMLNRKLNQLIEALNDQTEALTQLLSKNEATRGRYKNTDVNDGIQGPPTLQHQTDVPRKEVIPFAQALQKLPLKYARKTYNTNHPDYDANDVRNFPGKVFNLHQPNHNPFYAILKQLMTADEIADIKWRNILDEMLQEIKTIPHAEEVFQRKTFVEQYLQNLSASHHAHYHPGWVNLEDALFLYWVVRRKQPQVIVQTGVCNGLSSAFMMLALVKNGDAGRLHVVDMPPIFNSNDPGWKIKDKVYGVVIPEGKTSGWLVPDAYRSRFEVLTGDAKVLLPELLTKLGNIDMFYHDSDHTYDHMMFEFIAAKNHLNPDGIIVSDDIAWNASLWDFADQYRAPAYNYKGSMGVACF